MPTNTGNIDNQKVKATSDPSSHGAPKVGDSGYVELGNSDQNPERIERLGNYLSNTTKNTTDDERNAEAYGNPNNNPDSLGISHTSGKQKADFPIGSPGTPTEKLEEQYEASIKGAVDWFRDLSKDGETFAEETIAGVINSDIRESESPNLRHGSGHKLLADDERARKLVEKEIESGKTSTVTNSRWAGVGTKRFPRRGGGLINELTRGAGNDIRAARGLEESQGSKYGDFERPGMPNIKDYTGENMSKYWDDYFDSLKRYGPALKKKAANMSLDSGNDEKSARKGSFDAVNGLTEPNLDKAYSKVNLNDLTPEATLGTFADSDAAEDSIPINEQTHNDTSYGHFYTANAPFQPSGFPGANGTFEVVSTLTEIFVAMATKVAIVTAVLEAVNLASSDILTLGSQNKPYNNSYYPSEPLSKNPTTYAKGESGWRPSPGELGQIGIDALIKQQSQATGRNAFVVGGSQLISPVAATLMDVLDDEIINLMQNIAREMNLYVPRHTMTQMKNEVGKYGEGFAGSFLQYADVATAYIRAVTSGFAVFAATIIGRDVGKSVGFYRSMLKEIVRTEAARQTMFERDTRSKDDWERFLRFVGKGDKLMSLMNYLAMIGDLGVARGVTGHTGFSENKVPIDFVQHYPTLRTASTRQPGSQRSRLSLSDTPSMMLKPSNAKEIVGMMRELGISDSSFGEYQSSQTVHKTSIPTSDAMLESMKEKYRRPSSEKNRFSPQEVQAMEDQLEAEHMPFYIQDLRTNEIISFHAFLNSMSDSYTGEWSAQKGFGRLEAAQIYGGGSRSIGVSFTMAAMNPEDFDDMYMKINKLTTLVYPQWSEGTLVQQGENKFVQPFSQVPTASPLCRIRIGEIFASNYSKQAMARMMGIGNGNFKYDDVQFEKATPELLSTPLFYLTQKGYNKYILDKKEKLADVDKMYGVDDWKDLDTTTSRLGDWKITIDQNIDGSVKLITGPFGDIELFEDLIPNPFDEKKLIENLKSKRSMIRTVTDIGYGSADQSTKSLSSLFDGEKNPVFKAFESSMGRGIAVAINSIGLEWKLNSAPWNLEPGSRAPRMCEISLGLIPIHDITPGLDHTGVNRAPVYKVGSSRQYTGDVWHDKASFDKLTSTISSNTTKALNNEIKED